MKNESKFIKGFSLVLGPKFNYFGKYIHGIWNDNNELYSPPTEQQTGFGLKFDIAIGPYADPQAYYWKPGFYLGKPKIAEIPQDQWESFFGKELSLRIRKLFLKTAGYTGKYSAYNPWYGKYWSVLRLPVWFPAIYIGITTPIKSIYIGSKSFKVDPFGNDMSWASKIDEDRATECESNCYRAFCASLSIRSHR